ncbi:MAG: serine/threonine protein kinase [Planctomycetes bacterium]|nr:serine/threonine protein kinase [Planctomycetota bacterium]MBL7040228.1 serine/threonine protein kinase [Pirellulaceae bacterium]
MSSSDQDDTSQDERSGSAPEEGDADFTKAWNEGQESEDELEQTFFLLPLDGESLPTNFGRFELLSIIGKGGFGTVFLAHDSQLDRDVAVKIPRQGVLETDADINRFYREARSGARLRHANICPIYDVGEYCGHHYIVMGYIEGHSLSRFNKPVGAKSAALITLKLADALTEAHDRGIIHRDLKPSNIMIEAKRKEPVILDFGLARDFVHDSNITQDGQVFGTPTYMSPEQARGATADIGPKSDIYSLGVILYELVAGRPPAEGSTAEVLVHILTKEPEPPSKRQTDLDPTIDSICMKAMARDMADRFGSMKDFAVTLKGYLTRLDRKGPAGGEAEEELKPKETKQRVDAASETLPSDEAPTEKSKIEFSCPKCRLPVRTPGSFAGKKGMCPNCNAVVQIPRQAERQASRPAPSGLSGLSLQAASPTPDSSIIRIEFSCPYCRRPVRTPRGAAGKKGKCPSCGAIVDIPIIRTM